MDKVTTKIPGDFSCRSLPCRRKERGLSNYSPARQAPTKNHKFGERMSSYRIKKPGRGGPGKKAALLEKTPAASG